MEPAGGPVIEEDNSRRWLARMLLVGMGLAVVVGGVMLLGGGGGGDGGGDVAADRIGESLGDDTDDPGGPEETTAVADGSPAESTPATDVPPSTAPAGTPDLLQGDAAPAFTAFAGIYDGNPVKVLEIVLYPDWAYADVQVPDQPSYVDEYTWRGGTSVSGPEPQQMLDMEVEELPDKLFDLSELDASKIPSMTEQALAQFPDPGMEVTHVIIDRFLPFDTRVLARVYVSHPERGGGGYVQFTPDGGFVETVQ